MAIESEGTNNLLSELQRDVEMWRGNTSVESLVLKYGRSFNPVTRPKGIRQRAAKACFKNSLLVADAVRNENELGKTIYISTCLEHT
jgi:hypothetical protein